MHDVAAPAGGRTVASVASPLLLAHHGLMAPVFYHSLRIAHGLGRDRAVI